MLPPLLLCINQVAAGYEMLMTQFLPLGFHSSATINDHYQLGCEGPKFQPRL